MAKPELGTKRQCQACAAKFFDMNRDPIICPKCGTVFQGATMRAERVTTKDEETEDEQATASGVEIVSLDEVEAAEEKAAADPAVDDIDVEDDETADDAFLEEEEEDEDDVSSLIDGEIAPDEEP